MSTTDQVRRFPRVMAVPEVAREILLLDAHEVYRLARENRLAGAFKVGKRWFVNVLKMIQEMQP